MADVPDHLAPEDGLTNSRIKFTAFEVDELEIVVVKFTLFDEEGKIVGEFPIDVAPQPEGTIDAMIAAAHRKMCDVLRQWLLVTDKMVQSYSGKSE